MHEERLSDVAGEEGQVRSTACALCGQRCNFEDPDTYHEVTSWVHGPKLDGPKLRQHTGNIAHKACIDATVAGQAVDQPTLDI